MKTILAPITLIAALLAATSAYAQITIPAGTGDQMLSGMMGMMSKFAQQYQDSQVGSFAGQMGANPMGNGQMADGGGQQGFQSMMEPMQRFNPLQGQNQSQVQTGKLDGAWRGHSGNYLLIEGDRFRLHSDGQRYIDGRLALRGNIVGFLYPQRKTALLYRYRVEGDRMALQSQDGDVLLYQKIPR